MKHLTWTIVVLFSLAISSCRTDIDINEVIDQNSSFIITIKAIDEETGLGTKETKEIEVKSEKWKKLIDFAKNNMDGWEPSPASYKGDIYVYQEDFTLIYSIGSDQVIINFTDQSDESNQYIKKIEKGELDFLAE